jgi:PPM family protein phosphatase
MNDAFEIYGYSVANVGKEKNGDSFVFEYIESKGLLLAIVADGVSQQPCDWFASETTCKQLLGFVREFEKHADIKTQLKEAILRTNEILISTEGKCHKMASTLSVVLIDVNAKCFYFSNIGDSRVFTLQNADFSQVTKDDSVVTKQKIFASGGFRIVDKHTLTKVMGQEKISIEVQERRIAPGEIIILATDGFYEARKASFNRIMIEFHTSGSFEDDVKVVIDKFEMLRGDDLTVVMVKMK